MVITELAEKRQNRNGEGEQQAMQQAQTG